MAGNDENPQTSRYRNALVIGATGGIGAALARTLARNGAAVHGQSRRGDGLDITNEPAVAQAARALQRQGAAPFDIILIASGALEADGMRPEKAFREIAPEAMSRLYAVNAIGPALCIKYFAPLLEPGDPSVFAALSARVGSIGDNRLGGWVSYRASKAALNQIIRCAAIEHARARPQSVFAAIHPGTVETEMTRRYAKGRYTAPPDETAAKILGVLAGLAPEQSGGFFAYDGSAIPW